jgi:hypothetical protein
VVLDRIVLSARWDPRDGPGRLYPMSAAAAEALATSAMMLEDRSEVSLRLGREHRATWRRRHGWKYCRRVAPSGEYLRWDGRVVPSVWQTERERGEWPPPDADVGGWWPLAPGTPTLQQALADLNKFRRRAGLVEVEAWRRNEDFGRPSDA